MHDISLELADKVASGTLSAARSATAPPVAVVVLDRSGHVVAARREDGATMFRYDVALGKAWTAAAFGISSRMLASKAAHNPNFFGSLAATSAGRLLPNPGGLPILDADGALMGAVGVSGDTGENDETYAAAGIAEAGLKTEP